MINEISLSNSLRDELVYDKRRNVLHATTATSSQFDHFIRQQYTVSLSNSKKKFHFLALRCSSAAYGIGSVRADRATANDKKLLSHPRNANITVFEAQRWLISDLFAMRSSHHLLSHKFKLQIYHFGDAYIFEGSGGYRYADGTFQGRTCTRTQQQQHHPIKKKQSISQRIRHGIQKIVDHAAGVAVINARTWRSGPCECLCEAVIVYRFDFEIIENREKKREKFLFFSLPQNVSSARWKIRARVDVTSGAVNSKRWC